ncbi:OsmC family protein [Moheibacter stercoris]|uniref:Redox protein n=1 Tax=Moheibacter stercoris TaxID=1628251 RepID=A0ABV2LV25_9FLAO
MNVKSIAITKKENYRTQIQTDPHHFIVDEPISVGGKDFGPSPGELLAASLASCSSITVKLYADRKGWDLQEVEVEVDFERDAKFNVTKFTKKLKFTGDLSQEQIDKLYEIAGKCPIHRMLANPIEISSEVVK